MTTSPSVNERVNDFYAPLKRRRAALEARYRELTPTSARLHEEAKTVLPGGSTRDSVARWPYASYIESGEGSHLLDADGRRLVDFWFNATSLPLGHCHPAVSAAATAQLAKGTAFFAPSRGAVELGQEIASRLPSVEKVRFTNSGSEAVMLALRLARACTGRAIVAKFEGSYHGTYDDVSWSVGPPAAKLGPAARPAAVPESAGLPSGLGRSLILPFNDLAGTTKLVEEHASEIAALIVEPLANRIGLVLPREDFVRGLRALCDRFGIVLIFDEVISFRVGYGGAQGMLGVMPDVTTLGKIIGGGFPVGAVGGKCDIMMASDPSRADRVTHAGTFNGNPVTMAAGLATMRALTPGVFSQINTAGERIRMELRRRFDGLPLQVTGAASLFKITATDRAITSYRDSITADKAWEETASLALFNDGLMMTGQLQGCVSAATSGDEIDTLLERVGNLVRAN